MQRFPVQPTDDNPPVAMIPDRGCCHTGMNLRDYFAGVALAGILASPDAPGVEPTQSYFSSDTVRASQWAARLSYALADAMLAERKKPFSLPDPTSADTREGA